MPQSACQTQLFAMGQLSSWTESKNRNCFGRRDRSHFDLPSIRACSLRLEVYRHWNQFTLILALFTVDKAEQSLKVYWFTTDNPLNSLKKWKIWGSPYHKNISFDIRQDRCADLQSPFFLGTFLDPHLNDNPIAPHGRRIICFLLHFIQVKLQFPPNRLFYMSDWPEDKLRIDKSAADPITQVKLPLKCQIRIDVSWKQHSVYSALES